MSEDPFEIRLGGGPSAVPPPGLPPPTVGAAPPQAEVETVALPRLEPPPPAMQVRTESPAATPDVWAGIGTATAPSFASPRRRRGSTRAQPVVHGAVAGLLGGLIAAFVAFAVLSAALDDLVGDEAGGGSVGGAFVQLVIPFVVGGLVIGTTLLALTGWLTGSASKAARDGLRGGILGAFGGVLGAVLGVLLGALVLMQSIVPIASRHNEFQQFSRAEVQQAIGNVGWSIFVLWLMLGWVLGTSIGIARGAKRIAVGSVAGLVSGALAGLLAQLLVRESLTGALTDDLPVRLTSLKRFSDVERYIDWDDTRMALALMLFVGFVIVGPLIGSVSGVFETVRKQGWILISAGPLAGKQFILHQDRTLVGSNYRCDIVLGRDAAILANHAEFIRTVNGMTVTACEGAVITVNGRPTTTTRLRHGDTIRVGQSQLDFVERD